MVRQFALSRLDHLAVAETESDRITRYAMLCVALLCQLATIWITWPVWNLREQPVNLPLLPIEGVSMGPLIAITAIAAFIWPRTGVIAHTIVFTLAYMLDQYRLQPQFISLIVLMYACVFSGGSWFARWYLASMWFWAGIHKWLSAEWFGLSSWNFVNQCGFDGDRWHVFIAIAIAAYETGLGLLAIFSPRRAGSYCLLLHLGILLALSPLVRNFNSSVWPWNLATAIIGMWILRKTNFQAVDSKVTRYAPQRKAVVAALFIVPAGFYFDLVNPHLASVLYSGNMPSAYHTTRETTRRLHGWGGLEVPFPDSPRMFLEVFRRTATGGDKLSIVDPRWGIPNRYFLKTTAGPVREITREQFYHPLPGADEVAGLERAETYHVWRLLRSGVSVKRDDVGTIYSAALSGPSCGDELVLQLRHLPNLRELNLHDTSVTDAGLAVCRELLRLEIVEIKGGLVTDAGLQQFTPSQTLNWLHLEDVAVTSDGLSALRDLRELEVLQLPSTDVDDRGLAHVARLTNLVWLDLRDTRVTSDGLAQLLPLANCEWLNVSGTQIDNHGLQHIGQLRNLEVVQLAHTKIDDRGLTHLQNLTRCRHIDLEQTNITDSAIDLLTTLPNLQHLIIRDTRISSQGIRKLQKALAGCQIDH